MIKHNQLFYIIFGACITLVLIVLFFYDPATHKNFYPPCMFYKLTGLFCPGCGFLRAFHQLLHFNLIRALDYNCLSVFLLPLIIIELLNEIVFRIQKRKIYQLFIPQKFIFVLLILIILFFILRNIPEYPFDILAP